MTSSSSLYGSTSTTGTVSSSNYTTLYSGGAGPAPQGNLVIPGTLTVNGCAILTNCSTFDLLPTTATTINFGLEATALNIGANTGITTINNQLALTNYSFPVADGTANQVLTTDGAGNVYWALPGGGGSQFGNITIGITTDNTIDTTTGDLFITSDTGSVIVQGDLTVDDEITINADQSGIATINVYGNTFSNSITYDAFAGPTSGLWTLNEATRLVQNTLSYNVAPAALLLQANSSNPTPPAVGFGVAQWFEVETAPGNVETAGFINTVITDATPGSENFSMGFGLMTNGAAFTQKLKIDSTADMLITGDQSSATPVGIGGQNSTSDYWHIGGYSQGGSGTNDGALEIATGNNANIAGNAEPIYVRQYGGGFNSGTAWPWGNTVSRTLTLLDNDGNTALPGTLTLNGSTSGSTTFSVPATGSTLTYVLPSAAGAANTVLTNDGSGNLTWALPGGGGSTFGNVTVGVATDNTVSTTTGDLILDSATNTVNVTATLELDGQLVVNTNNNINMEGRYVIDSATLTTSTTTADQVLATYTAATIRSTKFIVQIESGTDFQIVEILAVHNGTNAFFTTYGDVRTGPNLATFNMDINSGNFRLLTTPVNAVTTYRVAIPAAILA